MHPVGLSLIIMLGLFLAVVVFAGGVARWFLINALGFQFMCKEFDMDLETVNEIAATPVLEKAYDDLFHPLRGVDRQNG